jgi:hypothetical protein
MVRFQQCLGFNTTWVSTGFQYSLGFNTASRNVLILPSRKTPQNVIHCLIQYAVAFASDVDTEIQQGNDGLEDIDISQWPTHTVTAREALGGLHPRGKYSGRSRLLPVVPQTSRTEVHVQLATTLECKGINKCIGPCPLA